MAKDRGGHGSEKRGSKAVKIAKSTARVVRKFDSDKANWGTNLSGKAFGARSKYSGKSK